MKINNKTILSVLITLVSCIAAGFLLIVLAYSFPVDRIEQNVKASVHIFEAEGPYPVITDEYVSTLDNYTDALMLEKAACRDDENILVKAMSNYHYIKNGFTYYNPVNEIMTFYSDAEGELIRSSYQWYWHGYLTVLKPALTFYSYGQLRSMNYYLQMALIAVIALLLILKKKWQYVIPVGIAWLFLNPFATACSLQFSSVFYISLVSCIVLILCNEAFRRKKNAFFVFFTVLGAATSFFDFLTYPLLTFGMSAVLWLCLNREDRETASLLNTILLLICWGTGYVGMWAGKWILATVITGDNILQKAAEKLLIRSSGSYGDAVYTFESTIERNWIFFMSNPARKYFWIYSGIAACAVLGSCLLQKRKINMNAALGLVFVAVLPFAWYMGTRNHSSIHAFFTHKEYVTLVFAVMCLLSDYVFAFTKKERKKKR